MKSTIRLFSILVLFSAMQQENYYKVLNVDNRYSSHGIRIIYASRMCRTYKIIDEINNFNIKTGDIRRFSIIRIDTIQLVDGVQIWNSPSSTCWGRYSDKVSICPDDSIKGIYVLKCAYE